MKNFLRRATVSAVAAAAVSAVGFAALPSADAASSVFACFRTSGGMSPGQPFGNQYVELLRWNATTQHWDRSGRSGTLNSNGCATFLNTRTSDSFKIHAEGLVRVPNSPFGTYYSGTSSTMAGSGNFAANLGTVYVRPS